MSIFGNKKNDGIGNQDYINSMNYQQLQQESTDVRPEVKESDFVDFSNPNIVEQKTTNSTILNTDKLENVEYGTGMPIDVIYSYIEKNWEEEGKQDAALNQDITYMNAKVEIIKQGLSRRIEMVRLRYNKMVREYKAQSSNLQTFGMLGTTVLLDAHVTTCEEHLQKIDELEKKFRDGDASLLSMVDSYKRGFAMGVSAKTQQLINNNGN